MRKIYIFLESKYHTEYTQNSVEKKRDIKTMLLTQLKNEQSDSEWMKAYDDDDEMKIN